jgi:hypothetical protein
MYRIVSLVFSLALVLAASARGDVLQTWTDLAFSQAQAAKQLGFVQTRTMAMVHLAMFEAINGADGPYQSYLRQPATGTNVAAASMSGSRAESLASATAAVAAHGVLLALLPDQKTALDAALTASLASSDGAVREMATSEGRAIAAAIVELRANDGSIAANTFRPEARPGVYVPTSLPVATTWGAVKPWTMQSSTQYRPPPPPKLRSPRWTTDFAEIQAVGGKTSTVRTPVQTEIARFWSLSGPAGWLQIVSGFTHRPGRSLAQNARVWALVSLATADAYISVFEAKYHYSFWRPITAIRNGDRDGNPETARDAAWEPLIETPMHPEYPCGHCIGAGAVAAVLESDFGKGTTATFSMTSSTLPGVTRSWESIRDYAAEVSNARIWGGIHYRNSAAVGDDMGWRIGNAAAASVLRPKS